MKKDVILSTSLYGSVEARTFYRVGNGRLVCYTYAIHRDRNGKEAHRTTPEPISSFYTEQNTVKRSPKRTLRLIKRKTTEAAKAIASLIQSL